MREQIRLDDPTATFQRWQEFDNGTGLQAIYHHWNRKKGMIIFLVFEETGEFICFEMIKEEDLKKLT